MMIFLVVDDNASYLFSMCQILKESCSRLFAIQCGNTTDDYSLQEIEKLDKNKITIYRVKNEEELLFEKNIGLIINEIKKDTDYRIILDIVLSDKQVIEKNILKKHASYNDFGSVRFATFLVDEKNLDRSSIIFYSRPEALPIYKAKFIDDTKDMNWNSPLARPSFCGMDESIKTESFIKKIINPQKLEKAKNEIAN